MEAFEFLDLTLIQAQLIAARGAPVRRIEDSTTFCLQKALAYSGVIT